MPLVSGTLAAMKKHEATAMAAKAKALEEVAMARAEAEAVMAHGGVAAGAPLAP